MNRAFVEAIDKQIPKKRHGQRSVEKKGGGKNESTLFGGKQSEIRAFGPTAEMTSVYPTLATGVPQPFSRGFDGDAGCLLSA